MESSEPARRIFRQTHSLSSVSTDAPIHDPTTESCSTQSNSTPQPLGTRVPNEITPETKSRKPRVRAEEVGHITSSCQTSETLGSVLRRASQSVAIDLMLNEVCIGEDDCSHLEWSDHNLEGFGDEQCHVRTAWPITCSSTRRLRGRQATGTTDLRIGWSSCLHSSCLWVFLWPWLSN